MRSSRNRAEFILTGSPQVPGKETSVSADWRSHGLHRWHRSREIIGAAFEVFKRLGQGYLEKVYQRALQVELVQHGLRAELEHPIQFRYKGVAVADYAADLAPGPGKLSLWGLKPSDGAVRASQPGHTTRRRSRLARAPWSESTLHTRTPSRRSS